MCGPAGVIDEWRAVGDGPCVVHLKVAGVIGYPVRMARSARPSAATRREVRPAEQVIGFDAARQIASFCVLHSLGTEQQLAAPSGG